MRGSDAEGVRVELYVRSLAPRGATDSQQAVVSNLQRLEAEEQISEYTVHVCGREIPVSPAETTTEFGEFLLNRVAVFSAWADRNDYSLGRLFDKRTLDSAFTDERRETVVLPAMALAEYEEADLRFVAPCTIDGTTVTVWDRLEELSEGMTRETTVLPDAHLSPDDEHQSLAQ